MRRLRLREGSHDKLAATLRSKAEELGLERLRPNRQTVIRWEQGEGISPSYARLLAELEGSTPEQFRPARTGPQFRSLERRLRDVEDYQRSLYEVVGGIVAVLGEMPDLDIQIPRLPEPLRGERG